MNWKALRQTLTPSIGLQPILILFAILGGISIFSFVIIGLLLGLNYVLVLFLGEKIANIILTVLVISPYVWWLIIEPLQCRYERIKEQHEDL